MIVALLVHLPFVPTRLFLWMSILWNSGPIELNDMDGEVIIPIDFDLVDDPSAAAPGPTTTAPAAPPDPETFTEPVATTTPTPTKKPDPTPIDAGVDAEAPDASSELPDAGVADANLDAEPDAAPAAMDAGIDDGGAGDASVEPTLNDAGANHDAEPPIARAETDGGSGGILPATTDAGLPVDPVTNLPDAGPVDAGPVDAGPVDAGPVDAGVGTSDPTAVAGSPSSLVGKNPNVKILIAGDRLRKYELGAMFGDVLASIPQWRQFIGSSGIDPVKDIDHMLIAGPQLRDSRKVVVVMDLNVPDAKARATIDGIVKRSNPPGKWLTDTPVPAAIAQADKGERIFAMVPGKHLVVVLPADAKGQLPQVKAIKPFNKSSAVGIALYTVTPANALKGSPLKVPDAVMKILSSLKWLRINVIPTDDSGVDVILEAQDKDEDLAREHAPQLETMIDAVRSYDVPIIGKREVIGKVSFTSTGSMIRGETHVTRKQLIYIMGFAKVHLEQQAKLAADAGAPK
ncbi:MAG: hypothetical protein IPM54_27800 [Polyangiaceae bacterium]|nr:hypothetical protein [Polyangiaceae bacterium]